MLKNLRNAGYIQLYIGLGLFSGFIITAYKNALFPFFFLGLVLLGVIFLTIKETAELNAKRPEKSFKETLIPVSWFYSAVFGIFCLSLIIGAISGLF